MPLSGDDEALAEFRAQIEDLKLKGDISEEGSDSLTALLEEYRLGREPGTRLPFAPGDTSPTLEGDGPRLVSENLLTDQAKQDFSKLKLLVDESVFIRIEPQVAIGAIEALRAFDPEKVEATLASLASSNLGTCQAAMDKVEQAEKSCGQTCNDYLIKHHADNPAHWLHRELNALKLARQELDRNCMSSWVNRDEDWPAHFDQAYISERSGVLLIKPSFTDPEGSLICNAVAVEPQTVLTSRHCFAYPDGSLKPIPRLNMTLSRIEFRTLKVPETPFLVTSAVLNDEHLLSIEQRRNTPGDYIFLTLKDPLPIQGRTLQDQSNRLDEALLVGWFAEADVSDDADAKDWSSKVRWQSYPCQTLHVSPTCVVHSCNSRGGSSGSAIWVKADDGPPVLTGIQSTASNATVACEFPPDENVGGFFNIGSSGFLGVK